MNELKQELDIDDHKIPIEELYQRLGTNPETVSISFFLLFLALSTPMNDAVDREERVIYNMSGSMKTSFFIVWCFSTSAN